MKKTNIQADANVTREYGELIGVGWLKGSLEGLCVATLKSGIMTHVFPPSCAASIKFARNKHIEEMV